MGSGKPTKIKTTENIKKISELPLSQKNKARISKSERKIVMKIGILCSSLQRII